VRKFSCISVWFNIEGEDNPLPHLFIILEGIDMKIKIEIDTEIESANSIEVNYRPDEDKETKLNIAQSICNKLFEEYKQCSEWEATVYISLV
jgi:hypothetical protein